MDVIDDTAQFIRQIGLIDENMRILISISIAICIIFIVIALLTLKLFNGIFIKVRNQQQNDGQNTLETHSSNTIGCDQNDTIDHNNSSIENRLNGNDATIFQSMPSTQENVQSFDLCEFSSQPSSIFHNKCDNFMNYSPQQSSPLQLTQQQNLMPNNDCTISITLHHHHHFHYPMHNHGNFHVIHKHNNSNSNSNSNNNSNSIRGNNVHKDPRSNYNTISDVTFVRGTEENLSMIRLGFPNDKLRITNHQIV